MRAAIYHTRNMLLLDFSLSTLISAIALIWNENYLRHTFTGIVVDIILVGITLVATSLIYEIYNFRQLHKLHTDIEDAVIEEETSRAEKGM